MATAQDRELESTRVASWLRTEILDGHRAPGSKLVERDLAGAYGVSRVPVRDALKILVAEGLVELRPRTWAIVRTFTEADLVDLDEVRMLLDPLAFRLAAERHDIEGLARLRATLDQERTSAEAGNVIVSRRAAADFHEVVTELGGNALLQSLMLSIRSRVRWALSQHDDLGGITADHEALFEAIRDRDSERAVELARKHVHSGRDARHALFLRDR